MLFNYLVCIWHIIVSRFEDDSDTQGTMDLYAFIATVIIYIAYQLAFLIVVVVKVSNKNKHGFLTLRVFCNLFNKELRYAFFCKFIDTNNIYL